MTPTLDHLPDPIITAGRRLESLNYRLEAITRTHTTTDGTGYDAYSVTSPTDDRLRDRLLARISPGDVVIDAGANVGHYTLPALRAGATVYALEPDPVAYRRLRKNVAANPTLPGTATTSQYGLGDTTGTQPFHHREQSTRSSYHEPDNHTTTVVSTVMVTLDTLVHDRDVEPPDHLKIDVEGIGRAVLEGARDVITTHTPTIYFEPHHLDDDEWTAAMRQWLRNYGYTITTTDARYQWVCVHESETEHETDTTTPHPDNGTDD